MDFIRLAERLSSFFLQTRSRACLKVPLTGDVTAGVGVAGWIVGVLTRNDLVRRKDLRNDLRRNERKMLEAVELLPEALPASEPMGVRTPAAETGVTARVDRVNPRRNGEASGSSAFRVDGLRSEAMPSVMFNTFW